MTSQLSYFHISHVTVKDMEPHLATMFKTLEVSCGEGGRPKSFIAIILTDIAAQCGITRHQTANDMSRSLGTGSFYVFLATLPPPIFLSPHLHLQPPRLHSLISLISPSSSPFSHLPSLISPSSPPPHLPHLPLISTPSSPPHLPHLPLISTPSSPLLIPTLSSPPHPHSLIPPSSPLPGDDWTHTRPCHLSNPRPPHSHGNSSG